MLRATSTARLLVSETAPGAILLTGSRSYYQISIHTYLAIRQAPPLSPGRSSDAGGFR